MNSLSWLIYFAEASERVSFVAGPFAFIAGIAILGSGVFRTIAIIDAGEDFKPGVSEMSKKLLRLSVSVFLVSIAAATLLPSRNTIMLIAASEVGETIVSSEEARNLGGEAGQLATDSLRLLRKYVTEQLDEPAS